MVVYWWKLNSHETRKQEMFYAAQIDKSVIVPNVYFNFNYAQH